MIVAVEDNLSAVAVTALLRTVRPRVQIHSILGLRGKGYLRQRARELNRAAAQIPVLMVVDLDTPGGCPPEVILDWFGTPHPRLKFRMAVMEIEAWFLADRARLASYLGVATARIPTRADDVADPKQLIVNLARRSSKRSIRQDLVPEPGSTASVGPAYTPRLVEFADGLWNPVEAAASSDSLARALAALAAP